MKGGPWSVTYRRPERLQIASNDYYSEGPYWWPDPKNPQGPYIRKHNRPANAHQPAGKLFYRGELCAVLPCRDLNAH
jgi:hypothetical protein